MFGFTPYRELCNTLQDECHGFNFTVNATLLTDNDLAKSPVRKDTGR